MEKFKTEYNLEPIISHTAHSLSKRYGFVMPRPVSTDKDKDNRDLDHPAPSATSSSATSNLPPAMVAGPKTLFTTLVSDCDEYLTMTSAYQVDIEDLKMTNDAKPLSSSDLCSYTVDVSPAHKLPQSQTESPVEEEKLETIREFAKNVDEAELGQVNVRASP
jgi:hypothetical protein